MSNTQYVNKRLISPKDCINDFASEAYDVELTSGAHILIEKQQWDEIGHVTIDHSSWCVNSIFRHVSKQNIRNLINKQIEIVLENEFLRWDEEFAKKTIVDLLATFNYDKGIPAHSEWKDDIEFENKAINALKSIICDTSNSEISNIIHTVENLIKESKNANDVKCTQIYERILYELNECSFKEFSALKALIKDIN